MMGYRLTGEGCRVSVGWTPTCACGKAQQRNCPAATINPVFSIKSSAFRHFCFPSQRPHSKPTMGHGSPGSGQWHTAKNTINIPGCWAEWKVNVLQTRRKTKYSKAPRGQLVWDILHLPRVLVRISCYVPVGYFTRFDLRWWFWELLLAHTWLYTHCKAYVSPRHAGMQNKKSLFPFFPIGVDYKFSYSANYSLSRGISAPTLLQYYMHQNDLIAAKHHWEISFAFLSWAGQSRNVDAPGWLTSNFQ